MKKILLIVGVIILILVAAAGFIFRKQINSYFLRLNYTTIEGQITGWDPDTGLLQVHALFGKNYENLNLYITPPETGIAVLENREILQATGRVIVKIIRSKDDPEYPNAFCVGDKVQITVTRSENISLKNSGQGPVSAVKNIGERSCSIK